MKNSHGTSRYCIVFSRWDRNKCERRNKLESHHFGDFSEAVKYANTVVNISNEVDPACEYELASIKNYGINVFDNLCVKGWFLKAAIDQ